MWVSGSDRMTKTIIIPNSREMIKETLELYDGIILGIDGLSVNLPFYINIEELENYQYVKRSNKKIFIMLNKNMHNKDLIFLKKIMEKLNQYGIDGVFYYDIAVLNLKEKLNISYPLIWSQEHLTTNDSTCNFWKNNGAKGAYLSSEITLDEIKEIRDNIDFTLFVNIFGYLPMFTSKRHLVKNYIECFNLKEKGDEYYIYKENNTYPIVDDNLGTTVYSGHILNGILEYLELKKINIDYVVLNSFHIQLDTFKKILEELSHLTEENKNNIFKNVNMLCKDNVDKGFFYTETVYKVKGGNK